MGIILKSEILEIENHLLVGFSSTLSNSSAFLSLSFEG